MTTDERVVAALEREAEFDRLEMEVGAATAPYLRATTAERDRRVLAAEVRRLRQRHAEAVEAAYREGAETCADAVYDGRCPYTIDAAWLASEARNGLA